MVVVSRVVGVAAVFEVSVFLAIQGKKLVKGPGSVIKLKLILISAIQIYLQIGKTIGLIYQSGFDVMAQPFIPHGRTGLDASG